MQSHQLSVDDALAATNSSRAGLSPEEARKRLLHYGPNELVEKKKKTLIALFLDQFRDFMILVLIAAAVISGVIGEVSDTIAIIVILVLNAGLGFTQEYRAEQAMAALKKMAASTATVLRNNEHCTISASEIVPGDIILLEAGDVVPADLRLIEAARLKIEEAPLTGESIAVEKMTKAIPEEGIPLSDRRNMAYFGTSVAYGRGTGFVVATGMATELGKIAGLLQAEEEAKTPLQRKLGLFGKRLSVLIISLCTLFFFIGVMRGETPLVMFLVALTLIVAAIPEALPAVVSISLALAAKKMAKQNALVRKLPAVETLGSVTCICTDKTGTLTLNKMTVEELWCDGNVVRSSEFGVLNHLSSQKGEGLFSIQHSAFSTPHSIFLTALALSNDARSDASGAVLGDPTEAALFSLAQARNFEKTALEKDFPRVAELPFDSDRKLMTTFHQVSSPSVAPRPSAFASARYVSFTKGAVEVVLDHTRSVLTAQGAAPLDKAELVRVSEKMAGDGLRVMAVSMRLWDEMPADPASGDGEQELVLLGLMGMMDPPRGEAKDAVLLCRNAGIIPVMITGDHPLTAKTIAQRVGILDSEDPRALITGAELEALTLLEFEQRVEAIRVYARVAPEQKLKIVQALQDRGHLVAMTGDGVNDAPALKRADIGVAMGITGTDVAKEASSMILLDDNFATIVHAVREGRRIYDGIIKMIRYVLSTNAGEIMLIFFAPLLGMPIPLLPIHILWLNLVTDGLPSLAFAVGPEERDIMARPPRDPKAAILGMNMAGKILWTGFLLAASGLMLQAGAISALGSKWQTMLFTFLCLVELGAALALTSEQQSVFTLKWNKISAMLVAVALTVLLQLLVIYVPVLNKVFQTQPLTPGELAFTLAASSLLFVALETEKLIKRLRKSS